MMQLSNMGAHAPLLQFRFIISVLYYLDFMNLLYIADSCINEKANQLNFDTNKVKKNNLAQPNIIYNILKPSIIYDNTLIYHIKL